jgi:hypothetical protein
MGMVAKYHHVQIVEVKCAEYLHSMYIATVSEKVLNGSLMQDSLWVHARDELDAWKKVREFLDGKRG